MRQVIIQNSTSPLAHPITALYCDTFFCRLRGLTFRSELPPERGLLLVQKRESRLDTAIHMLAVWMDLAVVWLNRYYRVVDVRHARAWRPYYAPKGPAQYVLEMNVVHLPDFGIGDEVQLSGLLLNKG